MDEGIDMREITIIKPDDMHIHIRQGEDLNFYVKDSAKQFKRGIIMPNTIPPVSTVNDVEDYRSQIESVVPDFEPLMTFKILPNTNPEEVRKLKNIGVMAGKFYPAGATTNSEDGITDWTIMRPVLKVMEEVGMVLSIHGEVPESFIMDREKDFLPILEAIHGEFPKLKIILEHISSKEGITCIKSLPENVKATITLHHLVSTVEDVINNSNNKCMPTPKLLDDRTAIRDAVFSGDKNFFFGSDSAPHKKEGKLQLNAKAGVYTAPVLLPKLVELLDEFNALDKLEDFVSRTGAEFYALPLNRETITLVEKSMTVPDEMYGVIPYLAGETIKWSIKE